VRVQVLDTLLDQTLADLLSRYPELRTVFGKLESEEQPSRPCSLTCSPIHFRSASSKPWPWSGPTAASYCPLFDHFDPRILLADQKSGRLAFLFHISGWLIPWISERILLTSQKYVCHFQSHAI
jgi:hypothetical protein